jgi:hypothetical protein
MGGRPPSDLLIPKDALVGLSKAPLDFIIGVALKPDVKFSSEELSKLETALKCPADLPLNRTAKGPLVFWTSDEARKDSLWTAGRPIEGVLSNSLPYVMGGNGTFWPLPLQRQGPYSTMMWEAVLPEGMTSKWLDLLGEGLTEELGDCMWTISKR